MERLPAGSRLTMASRSEPPIPLARQRAMGTLLELDRTRLAFDDAEAVAFAHGFGGGLATESVRTLGRRAEGRITGMMLGVMATRGADGAGVDIESVDGDDRFIADYLQAEVLDGLTDEERTLLRRTAFLDRISGPLCDAVLERSGSSTMLESMERANRFLVPLDHRREWYRHHRSLRAMLRAELDRVERGAIPALARRAAVWLERNRQAGDALEAARLAGDTQLMASLLLAHAPRLLEPGEPDRLVRSLEWFEDSGALPEHPAAGLVGSWLLLHSGHGRWARRWISSLSGVPIDKRSAPTTNGSAPPEALIRCAVAEGGAERMLVDARTACEQSPRPQPMARRGPVPAGRRPGPEPGPGRVCCCAGRCDRGIGRGCGRHTRGRHRLPWLRGLAPRRPARRRRRRDGCT